MSSYPNVDQNPNFPNIEEQILRYWREHKIFEKSVEKRSAVIPTERSDEGSRSSKGDPSPSVRDDKKNNEFVFYDGPPFANGLPHYGHLLTGYVKDAIARYQTMRGKKVERRFGWDCHGLPAEMGSEKELGISGRAAITDYGIGKFNDHCCTSVMKYTHEWEYYVNRQARWVDFKNDYKTMDTKFMESVLWAFKQLYDKGLVYEAYRVMPYSWAAETPLSNFETKLDNSYREREDKAITVAFELTEAPKGACMKAHKYVVLAWTTTPWTLPANLALAVNHDMEYAYVCHADEYAAETKSICYILGGNAIGKYTKELGHDGDVTMNFRLHGRDLIGLHYKPLFPYFTGHRHAFQILDGSDFVTEGDGTGIVHMAPGFGEADQKACEENGIEIVVPVDGQGKYTDAIFDIPIPSSFGWTEGSHEGEQDPSVKPKDDMLKLKGLNVIADTRKDESEPYKEEQLKKFGLANLRIISYLKATGQLFKQEDFKHSYPHCWRTDTPLIYRAMPSWYVEVTKFRDRAVELNKQINWIPSHIRDGQMGHMLATAPDWSISRNRFWGTPIPVWKGDKGGTKVFGSIAELKEFFDVIPTERSDEGSRLKGDPSPSVRDDNNAFDLHRPFIDQLTKTDEHGETWTRVEDVFDCWFESGSMPFAQVHYPFENKEWFETHFPADFITEYVGQTRGWFNTLIMLSTALFDKPPFLNCICHGVVLDSETGLKYSKRLKNYKDPKEVMDAFGADSLRWLMLSSAVMRGQDLSVDPDGKFIRDVVRLAIKPIWNAYNFFAMYANADGIIASSFASSKGSHADGDPSVKPKDDSKNIMDRYILAKCDQSVALIQQAFDGYDVPAACDAVMAFFEVLNNWYIRRSKERFWKEEKDADKQAAYDTLYTVLVTMCKAAAPLLPLTLEEIYRGLTGEESVHLADFPDIRHSGESRNPVLKELDPDVRRDDDEVLITQMDRVQSICNAALAIRNKVNIRVRQPLASLTVVGGLPLEENWAELVRDEVNVKNIRCETAIEEYATPKLSVNSAVLGKRLPALMKQIIPASKKGEWTQTANGLEICGELLLPSEYTLQLEPKPSVKDRAQPLSTNDALVILDTAITPELESEGIARDVVRMVQQARKDAGLHITDRIVLGLTASGKAQGAIASHQAMIAEQVLAQELRPQDLAEPLYSVKGPVEGDEVQVTLMKANTH